MKNRISIFSTLIFITLLLSLASLAEAQTILIEAESFENLGSWVVDQQFMDQMGSPYLLAHGLGQLVKDATTAVSSTVYRSEPSLVLRGQTGTGKPAEQSG